MQQLSFSSSLALQRPAGLRSHTFALSRVGLVAGVMRQTLQGHLGLEAVWCKEGSVLVTWIVHLHCFREADRVHCGVRAPCHQRKPHGMKDEPDIRCALNGFIGLERWLDRFPHPHVRYLKPLSPDPRDLMSDAPINLGGHFHSHTQTPPSPYT